MLTLIKLDELSRKDLLKDIDTRTKTYSKEVSNIKYKGITKDGVVHFETPSVTASPPVTYTQQIRLKELKGLMDEEGLTVQEKVRLAISGDLSVNCTCPAFKWWGYEYITTQLDSKEGSPQTIAPNVRNPKLEGTLCKHLKVVVQAFVMRWTSIAKDINEDNYL